MIIIGLGGNLPHPIYGEPRATLTAALAALKRRGARVVARSRFYATEPVPRSDQPRFVNAAVAVETALSPTELLAALHAIEAEFGRIRGARNAARVLDLDLLAYDDRVSPGGAG